MKDAFWEGFQKEAKAKQVVEVRTGRNNGTELKKKTKILKDRTPIQGGGYLRTREH
jgi:hypothetical protein